MFLGGLGFRDIGVEGLGLRVWGLGLGLWGLGLGGLGYGIFKRVVSLGSGSPSP